MNKEYRISKEVAWRDGAGIREKKEGQEGQSVFAKAMAYNPPSLKLWRARGNIEF
jgi:hypothetical protein